LVTYVLIRLIGATYRQITLSNVSIAISFILIWALALWMLNKEFNMRAYEINLNVPIAAEKAEEVAGSKVISRTIQSDESFAVGDKLTLVDREGKGGEGKLKVISEDIAKNYKVVYSGTVEREKQNETEVPASWFGILNSFFIIAFAPLLSKLWESPLNPPAPIKFGLGLILLGLGFGVLAFGSMGIDKEAKSASVSMLWLILAYLLHTLGELCVSPVGLSYVSKLAPLKLVGLMFGVWFLCTAIANYLAGQTGSFIDPISEKYGLTVFFLIFTILPIASGILIWLLTPMIQKKMHGVS
jgi:POT family proton-dependent oligopeptide transporter